MRAEECFIRTIEQAEKGLLDKAVREIDVSIRLSPGNAHYLAHKGLFHERAARRPFSMRGYENPDLTPEERSSLTAAATSYKEVLTLNPKDDCAYHNLGWLSWSLGQPDQASDYLRKAIALDGTIAIYHISLGLLHEYRHEEAQALREYSLALRVAPGLLDSPFFDDLRVRHQVLSERMVTETIAYFENKLSSSFDPTVAAKLGKLYLSRRPEIAEQLLVKATDSLPGLARPWFNLGLIYELNGDERRMKRCYERATFIDPDDAASWYRLGVYFDRSSQKKEAIRSYQHALAGWRDQSSVHAGRARRIYRSSHTLRDDIIPSGLLAYCSPGFDQKKACLRIAGLYLKLGNEEMAKNYLQMANNYN